ETGAVAVGANATTSTTSIADTQSTINSIGHKEIMVVIVVVFR
ncbi:MAG: hypothetical protein ACI90V_000938, partial [Bacillariaceae sp.]